MPKPKKFRLHYYLRGDGAGSASFQVVDSEEEANEKDENQNFGFGDGASGSIDFEIRDGEIYYTDYSYAKKLEVVSG